ncbi:formylglycine-generating enzyme family protein [Pendulispora albinea]|uniref:Formylglycine-generating enzyme family protein n=1 Tax=Pendulispora albinea TaxID=2741071 RepID=A0ABZ2LUK9_9BACT
MKSATGWVLLAAAAACSKHDAPAPADTGAPSSSSSSSFAGSGASATGSIAASASPPAGVPRPGMIWIPPGVLRAGTPPDRVPRVADEELPGTEMVLGGYYIDILPYPNEAGAIPTSNVTRDEAARLCESKGKRLCGEFEWERACKGQGNSTYEYGDAYRAASCGTGAAIEHAARRPSGERVACKSDFGTMDMHGGVWEWTDSPWARSSSQPNLGVLRGGNALAGELVGRCANAIGRPVGSKGPTMGFRCCAGTRNAQTNDLVVKPGVPLERSVKPGDLGLPFVGLATKKWAVSESATFVPRQGWTWHPSANEELLIVTGCARADAAAGASDASVSGMSSASGGAGGCGVIIGRPPPVPSADPVILTTIESGRDAAEVVLFGDARHLRMRGLDLKGSFLREILYAYGRVDVGPVKR